MNTEQDQWSLTTIRTRSGQTACAALHRGKLRRIEVLDAYAGAFEALQVWDQVAPLLRAYQPGAAELIDGAEILAPIRFPRAVLCSGPNFRDHLAEMTQGRGDTDAIEPFFFFKPPTTTVIGPEQAILVDAGTDDNLDWEAELGVVIGTTGRNIPTASALAHVAGYTIVNDISARGPFHRPIAPHEAFAYDWVGSKAQDTSCPTGPGMVPEWFISDPQDLAIELRVNDRIHQQSSTKEMINSVAALIAAASSVVTLQPGDIIATGTPAGVGAASGTFLQPGDVVDITIEGIGRLRNPVVMRTRP